MYVNYKCVYAQNRFAQLLPQSRASLNRLNLCPSVFICGQFLGLFQLPGCATPQPWLPLQTLQKRHGGDLGSTEVEKLK